MLLLKSLFQTSIDFLKIPLFILNEKVFAIVSGVVSLSIIIVSPTLLVYWLMEKFNSGQLNYISWLSEVGAIVFSGMWLYNYEIALKTKKKSQLKVAQNEENGGEIDV